jgi:hypothetical protein
LILSGYFDAESPCVLILARKTFQNDFFRDGAPKAARGADAALISISNRTAGIGLEQRRGRNDSAPNIRFERSTFIQPADDLNLM